MPTSLMELLSRDALIQLRAEGSESSLAQAHDIEREIEEARDEAVRDEAIPTTGPVEAQVPPGSPAPHPVEQPVPPASPEEVEAGVADPTLQGQPDPDFTAADPDTEPVEPTEADFQPLTPSDIKPRGPLSPPEERE